MIPFIFEKWSKWKTPKKNLVIAKIFIYLNHPSIFYYLNSYLNHIKFNFYEIYRCLYYKHKILKEDIKIILKQYYISSQFIKKHKDWYELFLLFFEKGLNFFLLRKKKHLCILQI